MILSRERREATEGRNHGLRVFCALCGSEQDEVLNCRMKFFSTFLLLIAGTATACAATPHDFHVSRCEMLYSAEDRTVTATLHIFTDDLLYALTGDENTATGQITNAGVDMQIAEYVAEHLRMTVDNTPLECVFGDIQMTDDKSVVQIVLKLVLAENPKLVNITNSILFEQYGDQRNILVWRTGEGRGQVFMTSKGQTEIQIPIE